MIYEMWITKSSPAAQQALDQMTDAEKQEIDQKLRDAHNAAGATILLMCECGWANEEYQFWGINALPDLEARTMLYNKMQEAGLFRYIEGLTLLGTTDQQSQIPTYPNPVFLLWRIRSEPGSIMARKNLTPEAYDRLLASERATFEKNGGCQVIACDSYWADEAYPAFGAEAFPSLEALQAYKDDLYQLDWPIYFPGDTVLGLPASIE